MPTPRSATVSISLRTALYGLVVVALVTATITFGVLWWSAERSAAHQKAVVADSRHAEQVATDYAVGAATIDYQNFPAWLTKLKTGTAPQLATKFDNTGSALQQLLTPLRWTSTATPIAAAVKSESTGTYRVDVFLDVASTSAQSPTGTRTTVTYHITVDRNSGWQIADVGGLDGAIPAR